MTGRITPVAKLAAVCGVMAGLSGCCNQMACAGSLAVTLMVGMGDPPEDVVFTLSENGAAVRQDTAQVVWSDPWYPNGKRCGGVCYSGAVDLSF